MRSEAFVSPDQDSDDKRSDTKGPPFLPEVEAVEGGDVIAKVKNIRVSVFPSEGEIAKLATAPAEVATHQPPPTPQPDHTSVIATRDVNAHRDAAAAAATHGAMPTRNWRNVIVAVLAVAVVAQAALMAYWMVASGGFAALTSQTGSITVTSEPSGSPVEIDGAAHGRTPLTVTLASGAHTVIVGNGDQARSQSVTVTRGGDASMHVQLPVTTSPPASIAKTALQVTTEPAGARVWIDGEARGVAPLTVSNLAAGDHAVMVRHAAGNAINRTVTIQQGTTASLVITMPTSRPSFASGYLSIQSPLALQVIEDGELLGTTDMPRIMLSAGEHAVDLVNAALGFRTTRKVTIAAGQTASFSVVPPRGTLSINALPWAEVWIDGVRIGETPIGNYSIPIGTHELLFRHPELGEQRKTVAVNAQSPSRVGVDMKKP